MSRFWFFALYIIKMSGIDKKSIIESYSYTL